jgi:hypothetical protein
LRFPAPRSAVLALVVDLVASHRVARLPDPPGQVEIAGIPVPQFNLHPFEASAAFKLLIGLQMRAHPKSFREGA